MPRCPPTFNPLSIAAGTLQPGRSLAPEMAWGSFDRLMEQPADRKRTGQCVAQSPKECCGLPLTAKQPKNTMTARMGSESVTVQQPQTQPREQSKPAQPDIEPDPVSGKAPRGARSWANLLLGLAFVGAFTSLLYLFRIESNSLVRLFALLMVGWSVHNAVPVAWRHPTSLFTAIAIGVTTVGAPGTILIVILAAMVVAIGRRRLGVWGRTAVIVGLVGVIGLSRLWGPLNALCQRIGIPMEFWPIAGSIFAFRPFMYLHEEAHSRPASSSWWQRMNYFLIAPNFVFPLFPIIDYRLFLSAYTEAPTREDVVRAGRMLFAGLLHLLAYRLVYYYLVVDPDQPHNAWDRISYFVSFYLLYLHVSGTFHIVIGSLCLFGYRLPPAHDRHLLSHNFTLFWRRTNTYWKDFNQKYVFYPIILRLEDRLKTGSLQVAVFLSLVVSWAIHSYQFWLVSGRVLLEPRDFLFWVLLAVAMVISATLEQRAPSARLSAQNKPSVGQRVLHAGKVAGFFVMITLLWSFWSAPDLSEWVSMLGIW